MSRIFTSIGLRIAIVGVIAVVAFVMRDRLSGSAADLAVGDCFDQPATQLEEIDSVLHRPCTEPHTGEVFHVFSHDVASGAEYPTDSQWSDIVFPVCDTQFAIYTGRALALASELDYMMYTPTELGWATGDREVICFLFRSDESPMTQSFRVGSS